MRAYARTHDVRRTYVRPSVRLSVRACVACVRGVRAWRACVACVRGMRGWRGVPWVACVGGVRGVRGWACVACVRACVAGVRGVGVLWRGVAGACGGVAWRGVACRAVPCRGVPCRAVRCRACVRAYGGVLSYPLPSIPPWNIFKIFRYS